MKIKPKLLLLILFCLVLAPSNVFAHGTHYTAISDSYNNEIIPNYNFKDKNTMSLAQIQDFLASKGSALASYSITFDTGIGWNDIINANGMTAAQVIYNSAQWYDINPQVILATLQKESSLVTSGNLNYVNSAMGYGCPEGSGCDPANANFARQVDMGTWQFYYNYTYSELNDSGRVGQYRAGNTATVDGKSTYIGNSATASLYRYTPHRPDSAYLTAANGSHYYGNYNFIRFYLSWFFPYQYQIISSVNPPFGMTPGSTAFVQVHLRNTGGATWYNEAEYAADPSNKRPMRLAVINADGQNFWPNNDTWVDNVRIAMTSESVGSGQIGSFNFTVKTPFAPGTHLLRFMPVIEGVQAFQDIGMQFAVNINHDYNIISSVNPPSSMAAGSTAFVQVHLRNTGGATWYNEAEYAADPSNKRPMRLAVINADGQNFWPNNDTWVDNVRIAMTSGSVSSGQIGSFNFTVKAPFTPGTHTLRFMPVVEGVQALRDIGMQFVVNVQ